MARIAIIKNGIVSNIIEGNESFVNSISDTTVIITDEEITSGYSYDGTNFSAPVKTTEELEAEARQWRGSELQRTDFIVPLTDYPNRDAWITYRQELRDWTTTENFPNTKPIAPVELN